MDCKECTDHLTAFLDEEMSAREAEAIRSHLGACKSCSDEWTGLRDSKEFIESHVHDLEPRPEAWNLVRARIMAGSRSPSPAPLHFFTLTRWRVAMATLVLIAVAGVGYLQYQQTQRRALDEYISQYIQEREARWQVRKTVLAKTQPGIEFDEANPYADNPFLEIKATTVSGNPFRSEDQ